MKSFRKNIFLPLSLLFFISLNLNCSKNGKHDKKQVFAYISNKANYRKKNFDSLMSADKSLKLDYYEELLNDKAFVTIFENSALYLSDALTFLSKKDFNAMQAEVCIYAMQNLDVNQYINFCNFYKSLYRKNKISSIVLEDAITPDFLKKRIIIDNYNNPKVIMLLTDLKNDKKMSDAFRKGVPDILSGKNKEDLDAFDEENK